MKKLLFAVAFIAMTPSTALAQDAPSATAIYSQAISAMRGISMPHYIVYRITSVHNGMSLTFHIKPQTHEFIAAYPVFDGSTRTNTIAVRYDTASGAGAMFSNGTDILAIAPFPVSPEVRALVREGVDVTPTPSPTPAPTSPAVSPTASAADQSIAMIVTVRAFSSTHYQLDNAGLETIGGQPAYHLKLTAKDGDTSTYPLTDMYVDQTTHLVRRVVLGGGQRGFFQGGGGSGQFDFSKVGDYWLVTHISIQIGGHMLMISKHASLDYTLDQFQFPDTMQAPF